jgi:hypothetical protein
LFRFNKQQAKSEEKAEEKIGAKQVQKIAVLRIPDSELRDFLNALSGITLGHNLINMCHKQESMNS